MIALLTTARKASVAVLVAFLGPLAALYTSDQPITGRTIVAALLTGLIAGLTVYETGNTDEYEPRHAPGKEG